MGDTSSASQDVFPLFYLPRELRDLVYEHMLVRESIFVRSGNCWPILENEEAHAPTNIWSYDLQDETPEPINCGQPNSKGYKESKHDVSDPPNLNIFKTCRQIYREASPIYYAKNNFKFICDCHSVTACLAFLKDRSIPSLMRIRSITVFIGPGSCDILGEALDTNELSGLVKFIRHSPFLSLNCFGLELYGLPPDVRAAPWSWHSPTDYNWNLPPFEWVQILLGLKDLKGLSISISGPKGADVGRLVAFSQLLRSHILKNGKDLGARNIHAYLRHMAEPYCYYNGESLLRVYRRNAASRVVVVCSDNERGKSLLEPPCRLSPLFKGSKASMLNKTQDDEYDWSVSLDYDLFDDSDNDSLNSVDLSDINVDYVADNDYLETSQGLVQ